MATYINTSILLRPQEIFETTTDANNNIKNKFAWLLLGSPTKGVALGSDDQGDDSSYYPLSTEWKVEKGKMVFRDANVCGIAPVSKEPSYEQQGTAAEESDDEEIEVAESIVYSFPGNSAGEDNLLYPMVPGGDIEAGESAASTEGYSINSGYLALVRLDDNWTYTTFDGFKGYYQSLWGAPQGNGSIGGTFSQMEKKKAEGTTIAKGVRILVAYDVSNTSMVNQYNFTGFNVGSSSLTISGLSSGN